MKKNIGILLSVVLILTGCGKSLEKDVIGKWAYEITMPMEDDDASGNFGIKCLSEYFPNKAVNHECGLTLALTGKKEPGKIRIEGTVRSTGEWSVADKTLLDKTIDAKVEISKVIENDEVVTDKDKIEAIGKDFNSMFIKGETTSSVTTFLDGKKWVSEQEIDKKKISVTATRQ